MPMSTAFEERLFLIVPKVVKHFGTPFHTYDEPGILGTGYVMKTLFAGVPGFQEFFAVKANPNPTILQLMQQMGFGFDCSSIPELVLARSVGADPFDIMFTSNNTSRTEYQEALAYGSCILNLDDLTFVAKVPEPFPEQICFRYNPGERRAGSQFIGNPVEAKYGVPHDQIVKAFRLAMERGAKRYGLHTMIISNELDHEYMVETVKMLLEVVEEVSAALDIQFEFINIGGGIGIPYRPGEKPFELLGLAHKARYRLHLFEEKHGYAPKLYMESGRAMTGPHGVLVTRVINRTSKHREYVGVDACMSALMRPAMYRNSQTEEKAGYHHITVLDRNGEPKSGNEEVVDVVGSVCENIDKFAVRRLLPKVEEGDLIVIHDTGAHGHAMGFNYNGRLRPQELILRQDGRVELIRRAETTEDYLRTSRDFKPDVLQLN